MATCMHGWSGDGMTPTGCPQCVETGHERDKKALAQARDALRAIYMLATTRLNIERHSVGVEREIGMEYVKKDLELIAEIAKQ